jgi:uridine kinase
MFNSAFLYEMAVIKPYIEPLLYQIKPEDPQYDEAKRLLKLLGYILPIPSEDINHNSLFREFIGGSCFNV